MHMNKYVVMVKRGERWHATLEEFTQYSCYNISEKAATIFNTIKQAQKFQLEIKRWQFLGILRKEFDFQAVEIAEIKLKPCNIKILTEKESEVKNATD